MNHMKTYLILLLFAPLFTSCDEFLSLKPKAEIVEEEFYKTAEGFEDALYGVYSRLGETDLYGQNLSWDMLDVYAQYYKKSSFTTTTEALMKIDHERMLSRYSAIWNKMYETIGYINNVLRNLENTHEGKLPLYNLYKGEALGMRAFLHFDLLRMFAPHITSSPHVDAIPYVKIYDSYVTPFSTVTQVYEAVIEDLREAEKLMTRDEEFMAYPRTTVISEGFRGCREIHFNLYAAQATLARVYWMKGDLENAFIYAKKVIDSGNFPLEDKTNIRSFMAGIIARKECIFGAYTQKNFDVIKRYFYTYDYLTTWLPADDNTALYHIPQEYGNDMRSNDWFRILSSSSDTTVIRCMKIVNESKLAYPDSYTSTAIEGINMIRIPEMYLIAAEALLKKDPGEAQKYFDTFIESRGLLAYKNRPGSPNLTYDDIIRERRKELVCEGQYFFTLKRDNMNIDVLPWNITLTASNELYTFPIPDEEFEYRYTEEDEQ